MINIKLNLHNPFSKENFKNFYSKNFKLITHKYFEFQLIRYGINLFEFELDLSFRGHDHAGPSLELGIFGYLVYIRIYDNRHWDYTNNCWEEYEHTNC